MRPNFLFVGPDKSGSSWLFRVMSTHPRIYLSPAKDLYFFDRYYDRGEEWYFSRFAGAQAEHAVVGEICHDYLYSEDAPHRIHATLGPQTRILVCLREPSDRAFSDFLNRRRSGEDIDSFEAAIASHPEIVESGKYSRWVSNYTSVFGHENVYVAVFDDLAASPQTFLDGITDWLGVSRLELSPEQVAPARPAAESRSPRLTRFVRLMASQARKLGLESVVGRLKSSPRTEAMLYRSFDDRPTPDKHVVAAIRDEVREDVVRLNSLTGIQFDERWGYR